MSATSIRPPAWLQRHGVTLACLLVVLLITLSLSKQSVDYLRLLRSEAPAGTPAPAVADQPRQVSSQRLQNLFGVPARQAGDQNAPPTKQQMTLLASFVNPGGLEPRGQNLFVETAASGTPTTNAPGSDGLGTLQQGYLETSNVNVVEELVAMIQTQRAYELNSKAIQTSDQMLQRLAQL